MLALIDLALRETSPTVNYGDTERRDRLNSHIVGALRACGISEDAIRNAAASDRMLVVYEP